MPLLTELSARPPRAFRLSRLSVFRSGFINSLIDPGHMVHIFQASTTAEISGARLLFQEYADWLKVDLCFQGFAAELEGLPGLYAPERGRLLLARL